MLVLYDNSNVKYDGMYKCTVIYLHFQYALNFFTILTVTNLITIRIYRSGQQI